MKLALEHYQYGNFSRNKVLLLVILQILVRVTSFGKVLRLPSMWITQLLTMKELLYLVIHTTMIISEEQMTGKVPFLISDVAFIKKTLLNILWTMQRSFGELINQTGKFSC